MYHYRDRLEEPTDKVVFDAIISHYRSQEPGMYVWKSFGLQQDLEPQGVSADAFVESMEALIHEHVINTRPMSAPGVWLIEGVPEHVWLDEEERRGVDVDQIRCRVLREIVENDYRHGYDRFPDVHWRTLNAVVRRLERDDLIAVNFTQGGPAIHRVNPLAARRLRQEC